jgi:hypothetical protein
MRRLTAFFFFLAATAAAFAQAIHWEPPGTQLGFNQVSELALVFDDCEPDGALTLPSVDGLSFGRPTSNSLTSMVNFKVSRRFTLAYPVRPNKRASINIPTFSVQTDKGPIEVQGITLAVGDATVGRTGLALDEIASAKLDLPKNTFWAGEVFPVNYSLSVVKRYFNSPGSKLSWQPAPIIAEEWSSLEGADAVLRGERRTVLTQRTRAYSKQPGNFTLKPATMLVNMVVGSVGFGLFSQQQIETVQTTSNSVDVTIQPLPPAPPGFTGLVGQFALTSKIVPVAPAVGEPVTWTLELSGTGNWPDISGLPQRDVSNDFQVVQPKSKRTMKDGSLFEGTLVEDVVLVPSRAGQYTLGPVKIMYFDTVAGSYKTISTEAVSITVTPAAAAPGTLATSGAPVQFSLNQPAGTAPAAAANPTGVPPTPPENLPRDALPDSHRGLAPFTARAVVSLCLIAAVLCPLAFWLVFAALRSRENDPQRPRREALAQLSVILSDLRANPAAQSTFLRGWQQQAATLWEIPHAAPGAPLVHAIVTGYSRDAAAAWSALWADADRTLHGKDAALPADWLVRAEGALQAVRVPEWPPFTLFQPRNLLPFLYAAILLFAPVVTQADNASDAYARAEFPAAEAAWRARIAEAPGDWAARHNLGLALAQQDHWAEATAEWTGAFLLAPRADTTRWDLALGLQNSGLAPPELVELARGKGQYALARAGSPGEWQILLVAASLLIGVAFVVLLFKGYRRINTWARPIALTTILVAMLLAAAATFSLRAYGQLAHPDVALVWKASVLRSIPTEADTSQKTSPLSPGSIAIADRSFLGWTHLAFGGGQGGWVRSEDVVKLYR